MKPTFSFLWSLLGVLMTFQALSAQADLSLPSIQQMPADTQKVLAWIEISKQASRQNYEKSRAYGDSALVLAEKLDFERGAALGHRQIATAAFYSGQFEDALAHYEAVLAYYQNTGDERNAAKILGNIGLVKRGQSKMDEAMQYFFQALEIKERYADTNSIAHSHNTIGETHAILGDHEQAEFYFLKALEGYRATGDRNMENGLLLNLGGFYLEKNELEKSLEFVKESKEYFERFGPPRSLARASYILGRIHFEQGDYVKSQGAYLRSKLAFDSLGETMRSNGCVIRLAEIAQKKQEWQKMQGYAQQALETAKAIGMREQIASSLNLLSEASKGRGDFAAALDYREACEAMRDSILNEETQRSIAELEQKYQSELRERELAELTAQNQKQELNLKKQQERQRLLLLLAGFVAVVALLLFILYRSNRQHNLVLLEKNAIIQSSLDEKEVLLREIHHRVKNNLQFISSLLNLQARHISDPQTLQVLNEGKNRIHSMALVHQKLYQEENLTGVEMNPFISDLLDALQHSYQIDRKKVQVQTDVQHILLDVDTAIPIGLILNELITNAFKYAFADQEEGLLSVQLKETGGRLRLSIQDNGKGFPAGFNPEESEQFGYELIRSLCVKLKADLEVKSDPGAGVAVALHISKYQKK